MTDLLALADAIERGALRCAVCGCNVVIRHPEDDHRYALVAADVAVEDVADDGQPVFVTRCAGC